MLELRKNIEIYKISIYFVFICILYMYIGFIVISEGNVFYCIYYLKIIMCC